MAEESLGQLPRILTTGTMQLADVSAASVTGYRTMLRELSPDKRIAAAAKHTRQLIAEAANTLECAAPGVPTSESWRKLARGRYGTLPKAIEKFEPEYLPSIVELDLARIASALGHTLESAGAWWCLSGALGCCAQGEPRVVGELDFLVQFDESMVPGLEKQLGESFWTSPKSLQDAAVSKSPATLFHLPYLYGITLRDAKSSLGAEELPRRTRVEGSSCGRLWVASAEELLLRALVSWRDAEDHEEIYWRDAAMLLAVQGPSLDVGYLDAMATKLDVESILRDARIQAGLS